MTKEDHVAHHIKFVFVQNEGITLKLRSNFFGEQYATAVSITEEKRLNMVPPIAKKCYENE